MAVTKLWPVTVRLGQVIDYATNPEKTDKSKFEGKYTTEDYQALKDVLAYAKNEEKTEQEFFCQGINCNVAIAREQFVTVKEQFNKPDGIQAYHGYMSFKETNITPEMAQRIGMEFAQEIWGKRYQVVVTTHLNTQHLHCHFVLNSVSFVDGKRCQETSWFKFRKEADRICEKYGIYFDPTPNRSKQSSYYYKLEKAGMPTPHDNIRKTIDYAIEHSHSKEDFKYILSQLGYTHQLSENRKYWTVVPKGRTKSVRLKSLGEEYTNDRIMERIRANQGKVLMKPFFLAGSNKKQYRLPTRENKIRKVGGLYGLYLYYCYKLGSLPKYTQPKAYQVHHQIRDNRIQIEKLTAQAALLSQHQIGTEEQLFVYKQKAETEIKTLIADRTHLRNKIRTVDISDVELSKAKEQISTLSEKLKALRNEVQLCNAIAERSGVMRAELSQVLAEEEKINRKEIRQNEYRR